MTLRKIILLSVATSILAFSVNAFSKAAFQAGNIMDGQKWGLRRVLR